MTTRFSRLPRLAPGTAALLVLALAFLYFGLRNAGLYPSIMGDEWTYSSAARLEPLRDAIIPNYLYYGVYHLTGYCGTASLECARSLNAVFFLAAAPFLYLLARRLTSAPLAGAVALLAVLRPANSYTAFFMPEAMYYCGFWCLTWTVFEFQRRPGWRSLLCSAAVLGLLTLVKVHALFLLPPWCVFVLYTSFDTRHTNSQRHWLMQAAVWLAGALALAFALRFALGYLIAGSKGLQLLGTMYSGQAQGKPGLLAILPAALQNLTGHLSGLLLMLAMPFGALLLGASSVLRQPQHALLRALTVYAVLMLCALLAVTTLFTASVAGFGFESNWRLHMRYYDFVLPLLLLLAAGHSAPWGSEPGRAARLLAALPVAAVALFGWHDILPAFSPNHIDSPELFGMLNEAWISNTLTVASLLCLGVWIVSRRQGALLFLLAYGPLFAVLAAWPLNERIRNQQQADKYIRAGVFARDYLRPAETDQLTLVGKEAGDLFKTRFMIDNPQVKLLVLPENSTIDPAALGQPGSFVMLLDKYRAPQGMEAYLRRRDFALLRVPAPAAQGVIYFSRPEYDWDQVAGSSGLSGAEPWGRWSEGPQVMLEFEAPLPPAFTLRLDAGAFGPNAEHPFTFRLGNQERQVQIGAEHGMIDIPFDQVGDARTLTITVPRPTSPAELGLGADPRKLGISLYTLRLIAR